MAEERFSGLMLMRAQAEQKGFRSAMTKRNANGLAHQEPAPAAGLSDIEMATRRLAAALDALESAVERRGDSDHADDELAARIQALGSDRSRLANELDGSLVRSRALEKANREIAQRLDVAIDTIRSVINTGETH
jgi:hypothetical protein